MKQPHHSKLLGLVLRSSKQGDYNRILNIATANGIISAISYNARRPKSPQSFLNQPFIYATFDLKQSPKNTLPSILESELISNFYSLRHSLEKVEIAAEICALIEQTALPEQSLPETPLPLAFILNTMHILESANQDKTAIIPPFFKLRYLKEIGFPLQKESQIINHIQSAEIKNLYNVQIPPEMLNQLITFTNMHLATIIH